MSKLDLSKYGEYAILVPVYRAGKQQVSERELALLFPKRKEVDHGIIR
jgi:hypothetical protein